MPSRRAVLLGAAAVGAATASGAALLLRQPEHVRRVIDPDASREERAAALGPHLRAALPFLILPDATIDAFVDAWSGFERPPDTPEKLRKVRHTFLLSTSFFQTGADESKPLQFIAYYDPYRTPCYNPLIVRS